MADKIVEIGIKDKVYPRLLKEIPDAPKLLYCRGNLDLLNTFCFGVVGTRKLTSYGKEAAQHIVRSLVQADFTIVSGLALGIDAIAHQTTLDSEGKTIAVLGTGITDSYIYPPANMGLAKQILKQDGLIISEHKIGTGHPGTFPQRNRIISGLSKGVLIVEADEKSGSLITARLAGEQGRDVFAIPGNIFSSRSLGPHSLIKKGAKMVTSAEDIIEEYSQNLSLFANTKIGVSTKDKLENNILDILDRGFAFVDDIVRESKEETSKVLAKLSMMEIKGAIKNMGNSKYRKI
ncbi:MAG: DNA protecting protein DprA [Candidatus Yanofskybacteria bacterium RIFCSPHIGHO2_02_FULL_41_11]|uniref:DNA protecting protein DprA n=1 Tax=Candidatus Yanofskybacteria bacterium RIFCSPHIGHO2_02_FULL_41_11 TaxID=1802675 RepID=A0A1F8F9K0_9BACT|nr:MAG: DNA protecting protein DprA [Candidatus Yanofskybacteria bacterium RIFCSPHIGHO2_02_FULL_41_11]